MAVVWEGSGDRRRHTIMRRGHERPPSLVVEIGSRNASSMRIVVLNPPTSTGTPNG
jgi:hypothetical protein